MRISIYGSGYVGLVMAACFAEVGHHVLCVDIDPHKIARLEAGEIPIFEPNLQEIVGQTQRDGLLTFTTDPKQAALHAECLFIAVGTPPDATGRADLSAVFAVCDAIAEHMQNHTIIINKSTVPLGTADEVRKRIQGGLTSRGMNIAFDVVSNPEFLKQGAAVNDFRHPDRIIVGCDSEHAEAVLRSLYAPFCKTSDQYIVMDCRSAELVKYAANSLLATKISFMNEMANIAEKVGADIEKVRLGIATDPRIGPHFIQAGVGYGGSCFGKDLQALIHTAQDHQVPSDIISAVEKVNHAQKYRLVEKIAQHFQHNLKDKTFALWGLAFKPHTNDMRDAPSQTVVRALIEKGARIQAFDPKAMTDAQKIFNHLENLTYSPDANAALEGADALILLTEWPMFKQPDFNEMKRVLRQPVIFDGRNVYDPTQLQALGFVYYGIGRGIELPKLDQLRPLKEVASVAKGGCWI